MAWRRNAPSATLAIVHFTVQARRRRDDAYRLQGVRCMNERRERGYVSVDRHDPVASTLAAHGYDAFLLKEDDDK